MATCPSSTVDNVAAKKRLQAIEEVVRLYGHHKSFHGWYWPNEAFIDKHFSEEFISYVNTCSKLARQLTPVLTLPKRDSSFRGLAE
jgi:Domain of unknown function (DUF4434)